MKPGLTFPQRLLLCLLSAVLVWFSFPNFICKTLTPSTAFLGWIALIPFFIALDETNPRQGAFLGWLFGLAQFGGVLYWIAFLEAAQYLSGLAWAALVFYLSLYCLAFGWAYRWLAGRGIPEKWMAPCLWVALEYIRGSRPWGGFSWGELGYSQAPYPVLLTLTSWTGIYGLTFLMVWFAIWMAQGILGRKTEDTGFSNSFRYFGRVALGPPSRILLAVLILGSFEIRTTSLQKAGTAALLQPSIDQDVKWSKENEAATYNTLEKLTKEAVPTKPDLVLWPETAAPAYLLWNPGSLKRVVSIVRGSKTFHLVGCLDAQKRNDGQVHCYNAAVAFDPAGRPLGVYHKRHLVPFGEFVPFQKYLTFLGPVVGDLGNFDAGESYKKFQVKGFSYTPMICYEVIFPGDVQKAFQTGADALVNISNDAWYGRTASPYQHAMMAVIRAAEERKPLLRAANTGICLATDPFGRILCSTGLFETTWLGTDVLLAFNLPPTFYARWGNWFPRLCWVAMILLVLRAFFKKKEPPFPSAPVEETHAA